MPQEYITLNDGNQMPVIAFGSGSKWKNQEVTQYVEQAIEQGFEHLDTAAYYKNEDSVGRAIQESGLSRSDLFVATKWFDGDVDVSVHDSLSKLGLKYLDLYLIHIPPSSEHRLEEVWTGFEAVKQAGLTRSIGVSNFSLESLQHIVKTGRVKPAVNQISLNPYNYATKNAVLEYCAKHGIAIEAYSSLAPIVSYPGGPVDKPVAAAAKRLGITPTQVIFKWVRSKGAAVVTTSSNKEHLQEYLAIQDIPPLTDEEVEAIDAAGAQGPPQNPQLYALRIVVSILLLVLAFHNIRNSS